MSLMGNPKSFSVSGKRRAGGQKLALKDLVCHAEDHKLYPGGRGESLSNSSSRTVTSFMV